MTRSEQKEKEKRILRGFLDTMGIRKVRLYTNEKPDMRFVLKKNDVLNTDGRIGVEITEHFNDAEINSCSNGQRLLNFWTKYLYPAILKAKSRSLGNIYVYISFNHRELIKTSLGNPNFIRKIASQIVGLVRNEAQRLLLLKAEKIIRNFIIPELKQYVEFIIIQKIYKAYFWDANFSASDININSHKIAQMIKDKNEKAQKYNRKNFKEIWLLIAAPHDNSFNTLRLSPEEFDYQKAFRVPHILESCQKSPFDRIFIWADQSGAKSKRQYYQIWPVKGE